MDKTNNKIVPFSTAKASPYHADEEKRDNIIGMRIAEALQAKGLSKIEFCKQLNAYGIEISHSAFGKWTNGLTIPNAYQLLAICYALDIEDGLSYFTGDYTPILNQVGLEKVRVYRDDLVASGKYKPQPKVTNLIRYIDMPISNLSVSAGTGEFLDEGNFEMVSFPENAVPVGADFGVRVSGDSMEPVYHDGQIVWVQRCETLSVGQVGIFIYDNEGFLKVYGEQEPTGSALEAFTDSYGGVHMQPVMISYNQAYADRVISPENAFQIVGRVL